MLILKRAKRAILRRVSPAEREFQRVWPLIDSVEGYLVSPQQEQWLFRTARALPEGANIVEVGSFKGRSTCSLGFGCRGARKRVFAVDTFEGNEVDFSQRGFFAVFWGNVERCALTDYVTPVRGQSVEVAKAWDKPIHFLFIDGSHQFADVLADFRGFFPHVVPGGIVALHDLHETWPGPRRAWEECIRYELAEVGYCSTLGYGRKPAGVPKL